MLSSSMVCIFHIAVFVFRQLPMTAIDVGRDKFIDRADIHALVKVLSPTATADVKNAVYNKAAHLFVLSLI